MLTINQILDALPHLSTAELVRVAHAATGIMLGDTSLARPDALSRERGPVETRSSLPMGFSDLTEPSEEAWGRFALGERAKMAGELRALSGNLDKSGTTINREEAYVLCAGEDAPDDMPVVAIMADVQCAMDEGFIGVAGQEHLNPFDLAAFVHAIGIMPYPKGLLQYLNLDDRVVKETAAWMNADIQRQKDDGLRYMAGQLESAHGRGEAEHLAQKLWPKVSGLLPPHQARPRRRGAVGRASKD